MFLPKLNERERRIQILTLLNAGFNVKQICNQIKCGKSTVYNLKKQGIIERKKRSDAGKSRTIDEKLGKILKKRLYGKRGIGLKKLAIEYKLSAKGIRRWYIQNLGENIKFQNWK